MSPGATFERVYLELRRMLAEGELVPGSPIEPAAIGREIASSITPVRDALHRLTGERMVEAPDHNGFRVPLLTEAALRDLYDWNAQLVGLAIRRLRRLTPDHRPAPATPAEAPGLFLELARASGNAEHVRAIEQLNSRLEPFRRAEAPVFADCIDEYGRLLRHYNRYDFRSLVRLVDRYHRRRIRAVPDILAMRARDERGASWPQ